MSNLEAIIAQSLNNPEESLRQIEAAEEIVACENSLAEFTRRAWHILEPGRTLKWGWALDAMCEHLEAVTNGEIHHLLINVPPGMMKSLLVRVFWPVWEWIAGHEHLRYVGSSYAESLALRDNRRAKLIVQSSWFQQRWGHRIKLLEDQSSKGRFENESHGWMMATSVGGVGTGERGDRFIIDDPNSIKKVESETVRNETNQWFAEVVPTRINDPDESAIVVIMQRTHEYDVSGFILEDEETEYVHLCLPMEFEPDRRCKTKIGFVDPRQEEGELLFPDRFNVAAVERLKKDFRAFGGTYAEAGQLQQRPEPRKGGVFAVELMQVVNQIPAPIVSAVRYWDKAGTDGGGAYTAGVWAAYLENGSYIILDCTRGQWSAAQREKIIQSRARQDGVETDIWMEQEGGSAGKDIAQLSVKALSGYNARSHRVSSEGDKLVRSGPYAAQVEIGNVFLLKGDWNHAFIEEHRKFPSSKYKDQVDAASGAFNRLMKYGKRAKNVIAAPSGGKQVNVMGALNG